MERKTMQARGRRNRNWNRGRGTRFVFASFVVPSESRRILTSKWRETSIRATTMSNILTMWKHMFLISYTRVSNVNDSLDCVTKRYNCLVFVLIVWVTSPFTFKIVSNTHYTTTNYIYRRQYSSTKVWVPAPPTISTTWCICANFIAVFCTDFTAPTIWSYVFVQYKDFCFFAILYCKVETSFHLLL